MTATSWQRHRFDLPMSEEGLIGALLLRPALIGDVADTVQVEDIFNPKMARIFAAMLGLWARGILPHMEPLVDELRSLDALETIGGQAELVSLVSSVASTWPSTYVPAIMEGSLRRRVMAASRQLQDVAGDPTVDPVEALELGKELLATIDVPQDVPSEIVPVEEFCEGVDTFRWLVPDLIEREERIIVVAAEAQGKSILLRQIAVCCAYGIHPFTSRPIDQMRVLLLDLENPESLVRRKVRPMLHKARQVRPAAEAGLMGVLCKPGGIDVTRRADARWLAGQLTAARPDLVVAGPLYKMFCADDKWEQGARVVTAILDDLRTRIGFALVLETHAPQAYGGSRTLRPIGSSLWLRWPEYGISFAPLPNHKDVVRVTPWKLRDDRKWPEFLQRGGAWSWTPCSNPEKDETAQHRYDPGVPNNSFDRGEY